MWVDSQWYPLTLPTRKQVNRKMTSYKIHCYICYIICDKQYIYEHLFTIILHLPLAQLDQVPPLNWSDFKPEFVGKPDEDAETHLFRTNDWMDTQTFQEGVIV